MAEKLFLLRKGNEKSCSEKKSVHYNVSASQLNLMRLWKSKCILVLFALKFSSQGNRTWHDSGEMIRVISLGVPLNSSDDDPSRESILPAAVPFQSQHLRSAALYLNERYEI